MQNNNNDTLEQHIEGGIQINPASGFAREARKWETSYTKYGPPGRQPGYDHLGVKLDQEYPRAMFKFGHPDDRPGKIVLLETLDVHNDSERSYQESQGFRASEQEGIDYVKSLDLMVAKEAAESAFRDKNMSDKAKAERADAEDAIPGHMAEMPRANPKTGQRQPLT